jgi:hypothetical protein
MEKGSVLFFTGTKARRNHSAHPNRPRTTTLKRTRATILLDKEVGQSEESQTVSWRSLKEGSQGSFPSPNAKRERKRMDNRGRIKVFLGRAVYLTIKGPQL